jgi:hypothetical protein
MNIKINSFVGEGTIVQKKKINIICYLREKVYKEKFFIKCPVFYPY